MATIPLRTPSNHRRADGQAQETPSRRVILSRIRLPKVTEAYSSNFVLLLSVVLLLVVIGLVMVLSSSAIDSYDSSDSFFTVFFRQGIFALLGVPIMLVVSRLRVATIRKWAWPLFGAALLLQLVVFTPLGASVGGNRNWIRIGSFTSIQPSEPLKVALILWLAVVLARKARKLTSAAELAVPALIGAAVAVGLVVLGHDLGTAIIMLLAVLGCLYFARVPLRYFAVAGGFAVAGVLVFALTSANRLARIAQFLAPSCDDYENACWQTIHGTWALASGGVFGVGLGNSVAKWSWLPAAENDFIFAIIGEELGLIGALVVILLFVILAFVLARVVASAPDLFSKIFVGGVLVWVVGQAFVNIAVVIGLLPVLGVPLPFVSSGGSALLSTLAAMGVVLAIARENPTPVLSPRIGARP